MSLLWRVCCLLEVFTSLGVLNLVAGRAFNISDYLQERQGILAQEQTKIMGQDQILSPTEEVVNKLLMEAKDSEMDDGFNTLNFLPSKNFLTIIPQMEESSVFKIIRQMPKGAALHVHESGMASVEWVVKEITYWSKLYMCYDLYGHLIFRFFEEPDTTCVWQLVSTERGKYEDPREFDEMIFKKLTLITDNPDEMYPDINVVWSAFQGYFTSINDLIMYRPAWEAYLYEALSEFARDNILYIEFRGTLYPLYELNGTRLTAEETVRVYRDTAERFLKDNPNSYFGTRFIYAPPRGVDNNTLSEYISTMKRIKAAFPDFVAGFDLVGQEDKGEPLINFIDSLGELSDANIKVFYHAGETTWMGMETDENLIDALLLNTTRIGHGYAIVKHPVAKAMAKERGVPLEVCPISNQVLKLVEDLRNHPAASLVAEDFPIVVSSDDPGVWGAEGLSYDVYEAFMGLGGAKADLRFLKQLAINSMDYSSLDEDSKFELMRKWVEKWDEFINKIHLTTVHTNTETFTNSSSLNVTSTELPYIN